jgi:predicted CXXCH cytochrome family protein
MNNKLIIALVAIATLGVGMNASAQAGISGSAHDFSGAAWNTGGKICLPCHTTHSGSSALAPLWNHAETAVATYTLYTSTTLEATMGQPGNESKACLSCHDGTVALDSFGGATGSTLMTGTALVGQDLSNDHPVSFAYTTAIATSDGSLHNPAVQTTSLGDTIQNDLLFGDNLECASCHDVHNEVDNGAGLLRIDNAGSALCLTCHDK